MRCECYLDVHGAVRGGENNPGCDEDPGTLHAANTLIVRLGGVLGWVRSLMIKKYRNIGELTLAMATTKGASLVRPALAPMRRAPPPDLVLLVGTFTS